MKLQIAFFVVRLLEEDICTDSRFFQETVVINCGSRDINVYTADRSVFMFDAVYGFDGFQIIIHRIADRILPCLKSKTFVSHVLQRDYFPADLLLAELLSRDMFVLRVIRTVCASVNAVIGQVQRSKHYNTVSVEILFDLFCQLIDLLVFLFDRTGEQYGCLPVGQPFSFLCLLDNRINQFHIFFILISICQCLKDLLVIDKIIRAF